MHPARIPASSAPAQAAPTVSIAFVRSALRALSGPQRLAVLAQAGIDANSLALADARVLRAAVAITPAGLKAFLRDAPQSVFLKQVAATGLSDRARRECRAALDQGDAAPTLAVLGRALCLSPATLRRRLDDEGASWGQLKDEVRRDLALQHLRDGRLSVGEIAARLGFNDASTFYRAFRKWTGSAPGAWRSGPLAAAGRPVAATLGPDAS